MLALLWTLQECGTLPFSRTPSPSEYAMSYTLTEKGMTKFIGCGIDNAMYFASQLPIPPLVFEIPLGVTTITMNISDMHFTELTTEKVAASIREGGEAITAQLINAYVSMSMSWMFLQSSYPFLHDNGTGVVSLQGINFTATVGAGLDNDCPGHFNITIPYADLRFSRLKVQLSGGQSWIYQALIDLILGALQDYIAPMISGVIQTAIEKMFTTALLQNGYYLPILTNDKVIKDARFIDGWNILNGALGIVYSGYTYLKDDLDDEYMTPDKLKPYHLARYNEDIVFGIHEEGFNNNFYIFHKYFDSFSTEEIKVTAPPVLKVENVAVRVTLQLYHAGKEYQAQLKGYPIIKMYLTVDPETKKETNVTLITIDSQCVGITSNGEPVDDPELSYMIQSQFNTLNPNAPYQISNTPFMSMEDFAVQYDALEHVVRLLGSVPEECQDFI